jgi:hypothetical protein
MTDEDIMDRNDESETNVTHEAEQPRSEAGDTRCERNEKRCMNYDMQCSYTNIIVSTQQSNVVDVLDVENF